MASKKSKNMDTSKQEDSEVSLPDQYVMDKDGQSSKIKSTVGQTEEILKEFDFKQVKKEKAQKLNALMLPSVRDEFQKHAKELGMSLSEYIRRAAFAAKEDASILSSDAVEVAEKAYRDASRGSRWTRDPK